MKLIVHCDGGARGNPGPAAAAYVISDGKQSLSEGSKFLGKKTNNFAEYSAVLIALKELAKDKYKKYPTAEFFLDSELITKQLTGEYKVKSKNLLDLFGKTVEAASVLVQDIKYNFVPREQNKKADALVNKELDRN